MNIEICPIFLQFSIRIVHFLIFFNLFTRLCWFLFFNPLNNGIRCVGLPAGMPGTSHVEKQLFC